MFRINNLNGFGARRSAGAITFSLIASGDGATTTCTIPGTPTAGDFCVIWNWFRNTLSAGGLPSGFTALRADDGSGGSLGGGRISGKILTGAETTVTVEDGSNAEAWIAATFRPSSPITSFAANDTAGEATNGDPASQTINAAAEITAILLAQCRNGTPSFGTLTTLTNSGFTSQVAGYQLTPADVTVDTTDGGSQNLLQSCYVTFT